MKYSKVKAYKYKLEENHVRQTGIIGYNFDTRYYSMLDDGTFLVKYSYAWDGSSIPKKKYVPGWAYDFDKYCKDASNIHDGLCQAIREGLLPRRCKILADMVYRDMCIEGRRAYWELHTKAKKKTNANRVKYLKKTKKWAAKRYWAIRKFGDSGIKPEKNPRNTIYDTPIILEKLWHQSG